MNRSKEAFHALRIECGISQADLCAAFGINIRTIRRWEDNYDDYAEPYHASERGWRFLETLRDLETRDVERIVAAHAGEGKVKLPIYHTQRRYEDETGDDVTPVAVANLVYVRAGRALEESGSEVSFVTPTPGVPSQVTCVRDTIDLVGRSSRRRT